MFEPVEKDNSKTTEVKNLVKNATDLQRLKLERLMKNPVSTTQMVLLQLSSGTQFKDQLLITMYPFCEKSVKETQIS